MDKHEMLLVSEGFHMFFDVWPSLTLWNINQRSLRRRLKWRNLFQEHSMAPKVPQMPHWLVDLNNYYFYKLFRMERNTFYMFLNVIRRCDKKQMLNLKYRGGHYPIDDEIQILVFLKYMSSQDTLLGLGQSFNISPATVMNIVNKVLYFVLKLKNDYIKFPSTEEQLHSVSQAFQKYPGTIGAIDGTHINISIEESQQDSYIDRYRQHSINVMIICDRNKLFTYTFAGFPGSAHDSRVFEHSALYKKIERLGANHFFKDEDKYHLIGHSAFPLKKWLMTPYRDNSHLTAIQRRHNYLLSSDRVVAEHAIGLWKERWRRLHYIKTYNISKTIEIASAACVLHNFCLLNNDRWFSENGPIFEENENYIACALRNRELEEAKIKRDRIAQQLFNN